MNPRYPVYIISKGRWESRLTARALDRSGVPYHIVVEPPEAQQYAAVIDPAKVLVLPFADLGQGSIPARNWVWEHAIMGGHARHWIMDDNIRRFYRFNNNAKTPVGSGAIFRAMEDFVDRYTNVPMAGPHYESIVRRRVKCKPFILNTRVYSCILLDSRSYPRMRWRGRYNEDTDLSLRFLKAGACTVLFNAFLANKVATMQMKGGNTDDLYKQTAEFDGRLAMARSLQRQHPDVVEVIQRWGRWQHFIDYRPFKRNKLRRAPDSKPRQGPNEYGMVLVNKQTGQAIG
ncbi:MAG: hypothetical protein GY835_24535 [bacterium]|nr:hypothetical protein [bacterium]